MTMARQARRLGRDDDGISLLEAAVVLPVLIVVMAGAFDFGRAFTTLSVAQKGLRAATRFMSTLPVQAVCGWGLDQGRKLAIYGNIEGTGKAAIPGWVPTDIILEQPVSCAPPEDVSIIRLSTHVHYKALMWQTVGLPSTISLSTEHEEKWLGQ